MVIKSFRGASVSRREFLHRASALGAAAALSTWPGQGGASEAPRTGGRLRLGLVEGQTTDSLDPRLTGTTFMANLNFQTRNCLVEIGPDFEVVPELAESFESDPSATIWTFKIREGVEFHNGKTLDAEDVVYSLNLHRGSDSKSGARPLLAPIKDIAVDGGDSVLLTLKTPNVDFPYILADYHLVIVPAGTTDFSDGEGSGGYVLQEFDPGVRALAKRNPNYWKSDRAHFEEVETINITDSTARASALLAGNVDVILQADSKIADRLSGNSDVKLIEVVGTQHVTLPMRVDTAPFDNRDVRLALKHAIDRDQMVRLLLNGHGVPGNDHPISPVNRFYAKDLPPRSYDPDLARFHLKAAAAENLKVELHASNTVLGIGVDMAVLFKEHAAKAGIQIEVINHPADGYWDNVWLRKPWFEGFWAGRPTEDWMFTQGYARDAAWNEAGWKNERFNELLILARAELDQSKRRDMYHEMQMLCRDDGGSVIPLFTNLIDAASSRVRHGKVAANLFGDGFRCAERWWFA